MVTLHGTASSMRKQKRKGESGGTERAAGGQGASLLLLVRGAIYRSLQRGQKIAKRWGGGGGPGCTPPLCLPVPSAPKTRPGAPFTTRQAADKPGKPPLSSPVSGASPAPPSSSRWPPHFRVPPASGLQACPRLQLLVLLWGLGTAFPPSVAPQLGPPSTESSCQSSGIFP